MDLYQATLEQDGNQFESNSNAFEKANAEVNNAFVMHTSSTQINTKGVDYFNFFEDLDGRIGPISGGGGEIDSNN